MPLFTSVNKLTFSYDACVQYNVVVYAEIRAMSNPFKKPLNKTNHSLRAICRGYRRATIESRNGESSLKTKSPA